MADMKRMKNDDFRKLLGAPSLRSNATNKKGTEALNNHAFTHRKPGTSGQLGFGAEKKKKKHNYTNARNDDGYSEKNDDIFDESEARLNEILKNYRDRAAERRKGQSADEINTDLKFSGNYKVQMGVLETSTLEAKKLEIQKSKYLGGDIEHTHLVKGLDYSLLNKVRTEIQEYQIEEKSSQYKSLDDSTTKTEGITQAGSRLARNICKILFESKLPQRNEYFARGRMAYLVDLEEDESDDVPSTLLRSVYDSQMDQSDENINADNVLINKLSQVLAYLRTDIKKKKKGTDRSETRILQTQAKIFEGLDEYIPKDSRKNNDSKGKNTDSKSEHRNISYFDSNINNECTEKEGLQRGDRRMPEKKRKNDESEKRERDAKEEHLEKLKKRRLEQEDAYAELYPGGVGLIDAVDGSDDDDYSKMDQGNRKAPIKRWDFDSQEDYERYQNSREAHPRAVYQFGVKTSGGRKTRKNVAMANERKIDRELDKINKILEKGVSKNVRF